MAFEADLQCHGVERLPSLHHLSLSLDTEVSASPKTLGAEEVEATIGSTAVGCIDLDCRAGLAQEREWSGCEKLIDEISAFVTTSGSRMK